MMNNAVYSIVTTYNPDIELLTRQAYSLCNQVDCMIIVDNFSSNSDEIDNLFKLSFANKKYLVIKNDTNMGLGFAQNRGIKVAIREGASHVLLLDQDSVLDDNFVSNLQSSALQLELANIKVGAVGPIYYNELTGEIYPITRYRGPFIDRLVATADPVEATFLIASGCMISVSALAEIGLMNEELFIDYIDVEWSFRANSMGYKLFACPGAKMMHTIGDNRTSVLGRSISVHSPLRRYYLYRNSIYMVKNPFINKGYKLREITFNFFRFIIFLTLSKDRIKYWKYSISGFSDGFKGVTGKCPHNY